MSDIARDLGLSVVTVSKVLRNHPDIAEETRKRVLKRVKEVDYKPNLMARSLVTGRSHLIGLVVPDLLHPFFAEIAKALSMALRPHGYSLIIASSEEDPSLEATEIEQMMARRLDGLVIASCASNPEILSRMDRMEQAYVLIDREFPGVAANFVGIDDEEAGSIATQHLVNQGCKRIAHIRGGENSTGTRRFEGYRKTLLLNGLPFAEELVFSRSLVDVESEQHGAEAMRLLLQQKKRADAVFCYNDPLAIGAMKVVLDANLSIPGDIAIIGCGNLHYNDSLRVPLSSIDQSSRLAGEQTAAILLNILATKVRPQPVNVTLDPTLAVRASSLKAASSGAKRLTR